METVRYPSDFILKVATIKNKDGEDIPLDSIAITFTFKGEGVETYQAVWDPFNSENNKNTDTEDNQLLIIFENYSIYGDIKWKIDTKIEDDRFEDDKWNVYGCFKNLNLKISKCDI